LLTVFNWQRMVLHNSVQNAARTKQHSWQQTLFLALLIMSNTCNKECLNTTYYSPIFQKVNKMYRDVGMAVPKTTATRCRDRPYKHCTNNPIPTSFFVYDIFLYALRLLGNDLLVCVIFCCTIVLFYCTSFRH